MTTKSLDLTALTVTDSEMEPTRRGRPAADNPFHAPVWESYESGQAKQVIIPNGEVSAKSGEDQNVTKVINLLRTAASDQGIGLSVQTQPHSKTMTAVIFRGKVKNKRRENGETATVSE